MKIKVWFLPLLAAFLLAFVLPARPVQAHGNLIGSSPAPGDAVKTFPTSAQMEFSEAVAPDSSRVQLLDANGNVLDQAAITHPPANPRVIFAAFPSHPDGVYSIRWQVQSAEDGHITTGSIPFSVGENTPRVSLLPPPGAPDPVVDLPSAVDVVLRGLGYLSVSFLVGPALFAVLSGGRHSVILRMAKLRILQRALRIGMKRLAAGSIP